LGGELLDVRETEQAQDPGVAREPAEPRLLIKTEPPGVPCKHAEVSQNFLEHHVASEPFEPRTLIVLFDLRASAFDDMAVLHAGRTGGLAGETSQAAIDV